jgi:excisionase family DNA binding protein
MRKFGKAGAVPLVDKISLTIAEASALANFGESIIRKAIRARELAARRKGSRIIILRPDLDAWLANLPPAHP